MYMKRETGIANETDISSVVKRRGDTNECRAEPNDPPALTLDDRGMIRACNKSFESLFGFRRSELAWRHVSSLFPQFVDIELVRAGEIDPFVNYLCHCGHLYCMQNQQGESVLASLNVFRLENDGRICVRLIVQPSDFDD